MHVVTTVRCDMRQGETGRQAVVVVNMRGVQSAWAGLRVIANDGRAPHIIVDGPAIRVGMDRDDNIVVAERRQRVEV